MGIFNALKMSRVDAVSCTDSAADGGNFNALKMTAALVIRAWSAGR
jgi:hypothetical protein